MERIRSQIFAGDAARLRRLGEMLILIADLPDSGARVLVGDRRTRVELYDLILQHRGTAVLEGTNVYLCQSADDEAFAAAGIDPDLIFLAPGYTAKWVIARGGQPKPQVTTVDVHFDGRKVSEALKALQRRSTSSARGSGSEPSPARAEVPGALRHAWTPSTEVVATGQAPAWTEGQPTTASPRPTPGPWHKPEFKARPSVEVAVRSFVVAGYGPRPFRLHADLEPACPSAYHGAYATQAEADAALPGFVQHVREILGRHASRNDTVPLTA